jgi:hypothetical protein
MVEERFSIMRTRTLVMGMSLSTRVLVPSVAAGMAPRWYMQAARLVCALVSSGRVTGRSQEVGVGGGL